MAASARHAEGAVRARKPAQPPPKPVQIKINLVNGESEPVMVRIWDQVASDLELAEHTLWNDFPVESRSTPKMATAI